MNSFPPSPHKIKSPKESRTWRGESLNVPRSPLAEHANYCNRKTRVIFPPGKWQACYALPAQNVQHIL